MSQKKPPVPAATPNNPFGALASLRDQLPVGKSVAATKPVAEKKPALRAVVRYERKGHGGKEATRVTHLCAHAKDAETWVKTLKQKLGCGGQAEGPDIVLQGDQRPRLPALLEQLGVEKITVA